MNNINIKFLYCFFCFGMMFFYACESETEILDESGFGYNFFPVAEGRSWTYASDSIIYSGVGTKRDTFRSFIKEEIGDKFTDLEGQTLYKVNRYFKRSENNSWSKINTWTVSMDKTRAIRTEENIRFIKMVFPIKKGLRFDGNVFVDENIKVEVGGEMIEAYKNWNQRIEAIDEFYPYNGEAVKSIKVNLVDDISIIDRRKVTEYYGENIGLIRKEMMILDSDGSRPNDSWESKAQKGFIHTMTLIDHK
jgi:hypothetical protein